MATSDAQQREKYERPPEMNRPHAEDVDGGDAEVPAKELSKKRRAFRR